MPSPKMRLGTAVARSQLANQRPGAAVVKRCHAAGRSGWFHAYIAAMRTGADTAASGVIVQSVGAPGRGAAARVIAGARARAAAAITPVRKRIPPGVAENAGGVRAN